MEIGKEILRQLGGNRFIAMTGSKNFGYSDKSLSMRLTRNKLKAKWLRITLTAMDDYTLEFIGQTGKFGAPKIIKTIGGIYADQLQDVFTQETGLLTSL